MRRFRISIAGLLAVVALVGVAIAALIHPSPLVGNAAYSATLATLILAVLAAIYSRGRARAFRVGFATCGWAYFLAAFGLGPIPPIAPGLVTGAILDIIYPYTVPATAPAAALVPAGPGPSRGGARVILAGAFGGSVKAPQALPTPWEIWTRPDRKTGFNQMCPAMFRRIGHCLFCLISALIGGTLARRFHDSRDREATPAA